MWFFFILICCLDFCCVELGKVLGEVEVDRRGMGLVRSLSLFFLKVVVIGVGRERDVGVGVGGFAYLL